MLDKLQQHSFKILFAIIVVTNAFVFANVLYNRSGEAHPIVLTERELPLSWRDNENSGVSLQFEFRVFYQKVKNEDGGLDRISWLSYEKMLALGFSKNDLYVEDKERYKRVLPKEVYVALEYDGAEYQKSLAQEEQRFALVKEDENTGPQKLRYAQRELDQEKLGSSRLFAIDAELDLQQLKQKYNQDNVFFAKALVRPDYSVYPYRTHRYGYLESLIIESINIPYPANTSLNELEPRRYDDIESPRYEVELSIGRSLEPIFGSLLLYTESESTPKTTEPSS